MISKKTKKGIILLASAALCFCAGAAFAVSGIGSVAANVTSNLSGVAKLITAGSYVAGFGFAVGAVVKFKAHKDNPTQIPLSTPIALLFVGAALIFIPSVFQSTGMTLFGTTSGVGKVSGITSF
jgi:intracellular multiplication protein IcmD